MSSTTMEQFVPPFRTVYWGLIIASAFYGMSLIQAFMYYSAYNDGFLLKATVAGLILLDTGDSLASAFGVQTYVIDNWGNKEIIEVLPAGLTAELFLSLFIVIIVQFFFARQIYRFNKKAWPWCLLIVILAIAAAVLNFAFSIYSFQAQVVAVAQQRPWKYFVTVASILATVIDLLAALLLTIFLNAAREYQMKSTDSILKRIFLFTVTRALVLSAVQLTFVVIYITIPASQIWAPFRLLVAKVYVNTFLAMLNTRSRLAKQRDPINVSASANSRFFRWTKASNVVKSPISFNPPRSNGISNTFSTDVELPTIDSESFTMSKQGNSMDTGSKPDVSSRV